MILLLHLLLSRFDFLLYLPQLSGLPLDQLEHPLILLVLDAASLGPEGLRAETVEFRIRLGEESLQVLHPRVAQRGLKVVQSFLGTQEIMARLGQLRFQRYTLVLLAELIDILIESTSLRN